MADTEIFLQAHHYSIVVRKLKETFFNILAIGIKKTTKGRKKVNVINFTKPIMLPQARRALKVCVRYVFMLHRVYFDWLKSPISTN